MTMQGHRLRRFLFSRYEDRFGVMALVMVKGDDSLRMPSRLGVISVAQRSRPAAFCAAHASWTGKPNDRAEGKKQHDTQQNPKHGISDMALKCFHLSSP